MCPCATCRRWSRSAFAELPGGVFNRGFVRAYARFCGLDEDEAVAGYTDAMRQQGQDPEQQEADWTTFAENVKRNREALRPQRRMRWMGVFAMVVAVVVLGAAVFGLLIRRGVVPAPAKLQRLVRGERVAPVQDGSRHVALSTAAR